MTIDIICPLYNAEDCIQGLHASILKQEKVQIKSINYILTESKDNTEEILIENNIKYEKIKKEDFSHSLIRERTAFNCKGDILVFITQDIKPQNDTWLYELTKDINMDIVATFSKQIASMNNIEKYTREKNYPKESYVVSKEDIDSYGLKTFFFSDAASAIKRDVFINLNGYDGKDLPISEDMYIAYKIIMGGYKIKYCSLSIVIHSHNFSLKELYNRYKLTGRFFKENDYLNKYGTNKSGSELAIYVLKRILEEHNFKALLRYPFDMASRFIGMKVGKM